MNPSDMAWILICSALVLLMTPGLAFFYGGLARKKNMLNTLMMSFSSLGVVGVLWCVVGYSIAFGSANGFWGGFEYAFLKGVDLSNQDGLPHLLFMAFQGTFAIITAALISGAVIERMSFRAYLIFIGLWSLVVYAPVCHWVWGSGWLEAYNILDFAGGTVVHVNAGVAAFVAALVLKPRKDYGRQALLPHNIPFVLLGAGLLWFGWFGFNGGSALAANESAVLAFVNTLFAPAGTILIWIILDFYKFGRATGVGLATAIVVGLVAITPAAGFISPINAILLGVIAAIPSYFLILKRPKTALDDSLDVVAAHGIGGLSGALLTGVFAEALWGGEVGLLFGNSDQFIAQVIGVVVTIIYSAIVTYALLKLINLVFPLRMSDKEQSIGMDTVLHHEAAYSEGVVGIVT